MCTVCGCGTAHVIDHPDPTLRTGAVVHDHRHADAHDHAHAPVRHGDHIHEAAASVEFGKGLAGVDVPGLSQERTIRIERDILSKNQAFADANRARFRNTGTFCLNVMSSPGSGKTSLLVRTIDDMKGQWAIAVIEGDQQTSRDAERIRATGVPAIQINTGKGCHLDAHMVGHALDHLAMPQDSVLFIENVGNLVCPAAFDLGEAHKVVILSVTEGEDKPFKYPDMFAASDLMLLNKSDLLPHVEFDENACRAAALRVNPRIEIMTVSARTGQGLPEFYTWIEARAGLTSCVAVTPASEA